MVTLMKSHEWPAAVAYLTLSILLILHVFGEGHEDGRVRVWDATAAVPELRATVPFDSGGAGPKLKPVVTSQVTFPDIHSMHIHLQVCSDTADQHCLEAFSLTKSLQWSLCVFPPSDADLSVTRL